MPTTPADDAVAGLTDVVDELYLLAPADFVGRRDELAVQSRSAGDKRLAAAVRRLRRPTTSAWALNLLSREEPDLVAQLLELGESLRQAQAGLDGATLRELDKQRRAVVGALARRAGALVADRGHRFDAELSRQVEQSLVAALSDPDAGAAVTSGQLTRAVSVVGFGVEVEVDAVAVPALVLVGAGRRRGTTPHRRTGATSGGAAGDGSEPAPTVAGPKATRRSATPHPTRSLDDARARREEDRRDREQEARRAELRATSEAAREALAAARTGESEAEQSAREAATRVDELRTRLDELRVERADLAARLARCDEQVAATGARLTDHEQRQDEADQALLDARRATRRAERAAEQAEQAAGR